MFPRRDLFFYLLPVLFKSTGAHTQIEAAHKMNLIDLNTPKDVAVDASGNKRRHEAAFKYESFRSMLSRS